MLATFAALSVWVATHAVSRADERATFWVQDLRRFSGVDATFTQVNRAGDYDVVAGVIAMSVAVLLMRRLWPEALIMAGAGAAHYAEEAMRAIVERPHTVLTNVGAHIQPASDGFPSGHVFGEVLVYGLVFAYAGRAIPWRPLATLVRMACGIEIMLGGPARMYTGAHWLSDVAGAAMLAALYLLLAARVDPPALRGR